MGEKDKEIKEEKKVTEKSKDDKNNWVVPTVLVVAVIAIIIILTYMIVTSSDPKKTIDGLFTDLKAGDFENTQEFFAADGGLDTSDIFEDSLSDETKALLFDKLEWKVIKVNESGEEASAEVEITNKNFKIIIANMIQKVIKAEFSGESTQNYLIEELKKDEVETITSTKTIKLVKIDKKWKIAQDEELTDALLPGLKDAVNFLN